MEEPECPANLRKRSPRPLRGDGSSRRIELDREHSRPLDAVARSHTVGSCKFINWRSDMRYRKGHVAISEDRDVPVLLHIRNARAITLDQLWDLLALERIEESRRSAQWRIARLEKSGLI